MLTNIRSVPILSVRWMHPNCWTVLLLVLFLHFVKPNLPIRNNPFLNTCVSVKAHSFYKGIFPVTRNYTEMYTIQFIKTKKPLTPSYDILSTRQNVRGLFSRAILSGVIIVISSACPKRDTDDSPLLFCCVSVFNPTSTLHLPSIGKFDKKHRKQYSLKRGPANAHQPCTLNRCTDKVIFDRSLHYPNPQTLEQTGVWMDDGWMQEWKDGSVSLGCAYIYIYI